MNLEIIIQYNLFLYLITEIKKIDTNHVFNIDIEMIKKSTKPDNFVIYLNNFTEQYGISQIICRSNTNYLDYENIYLQCIRILKQKEVKK